MTERIRRDMKRQRDQQRRNKTETNVLVEIVNPIIPYFLIQALLLLHLYFYP